MKGNLLNLDKKNSYLVLYGLVFLGLISLIVLLKMVDPELRKSLIEENGLIELSSCIGYFVCLAMLSFFKVNDAKSKWCIMLILLAFGLRELDFHVLFTTMGITKTKFYLSPEVPVLEKVFGIFVFASLAYIVFYVVRRHFSAYMVALKEREPFAAGVFFGILLIFASKGIDGLPRQLNSIGFDITKNMVGWMSIIEETIELGIPVMFMISIATYFYRPWLFKANTLIITKQ